MNTVGSVWNKWDLHIHTPESFQWSDGKRFSEQEPEEQTKACESIVDKLNELDVVAFCIMDYWTFEGYILLRRYIKDNPGCTAKRIFPGIELRINAPTNFRLNSHVLLNDELDDDMLRVFQNKLQMACPEKHALIRQNFITVAKGYDIGKLNHHGYSQADRTDDAKMCVLGMKTVVVSTESIDIAIDAVGSSNCLIIQPYGTNDGVEGLDWKKHSYADNTIMKWAHCFETRKQDEVDLFLGTETEANKSFLSAFQQNLSGYPKPVFSGSDAHCIADYGNYPSNRTTWLKAQPTFKGLQQVCNEPALRCHIGETPKKLGHVQQNPTKYLKTLALKKCEGSMFDEHWFDGKEILLNPGLIAIIGNKGSGKSALADILALAGNSHCPKMEFLNGDRFRKNNDNKAKHFEATLTWADETEVKTSLDENADKQKPERVRYLPQHFIEDLCNEIATGSNGDFEKELKKVIFSHIPRENQLHTGTLDDLLEYLVKTHKEALALIQQDIRDLNEHIVRNEEEMSEETLKTYQTALELKEKELEALNKQPLDLVEKPSEDPEDEATKKAVDDINDAKNSLNVVTETIHNLHTERQARNAEQAAITQLIGYVDNFETQHNAFVEDHQEEFVERGLDINEIVTVTIDRTPLTKSLKQATNRISEIQVLLDGKDATETEKAVKGLETRSMELNEKITKVQEGLNAPQKAYQAYLKEVQERKERRDAIIGADDQPDTIEYYKQRILRATAAVPEELTTLREERHRLVREAHVELAKIRKTYEVLYAPVQKIASDAATPAHAIQLEFDASVVDSGFEENFFDFINRGRKGNFYGQEESHTLLCDLLQEHDFNSSDAVVEFTDVLMDKLINIEKDGEKKSVSIKSQLKDKKKLTALYNYIFQLDYLEIRYTLRLGGKSISQLSPGEKGALLLVFYLLLDTEEIPIIIDQPEHNLDNESVVRLLVDCIRMARARRQVFIVTHNPNLAVYCDADQLICCKIDKTDGHRINYTTGAIEDYNINRFAIDVLEGTYPAFDNRRKKWHKPIMEITATEDSNE
ncbi:TrlF family AAA-like ATPase [Symmachiella dynata]|uniref:TrlF family AAA-like ATPase n=1 Tax=Symmachiella dynata TaxID=2527995 RepID=UPI0030EF25E2|tara:strand:+ start:224 stop:3346 length:3123 start_codon:yes stop_codon:yes gene_type:complete